jgi:hypothetical protein
LLLVLSPLLPPLLLLLLPPLLPPLLPLLFCSTGCSNGCICSTGCSGGVPHMSVIIFPSLQVQPYASSNAATQNTLIALWLGSKCRKRRDSICTDRNQFVCLETTHLVYSTTSINRLLTASGATKRNSLNFGLVGRIQVQKVKRVSQSKSNIVWI